MKEKPSDDWCSSHMMEEYVITAKDLAVTDTIHVRALEWVHVAARVFSTLLTVSKAKRERKAGNLRLNGELLVATNIHVQLHDRLQYLRYRDSTTSNGNQSEQIPYETNQTHIKKRKKWLQTCITQGLRLVYENDMLAVIVKPVGIHVKGRGQRTVEQALPLLLHRHESNKQSDYLSSPQTVHRLDARVGGMLLVAKTRKMEVTLAAQFEHHAVVKQYRAILVGKVDAQQLMIKNPHLLAPASIIKKDDLVLPQALAKIRHELFFIHLSIDGRCASTAMRTVSISRSGRYDWITTVDLWPLTGRKHQLRIHTARLGHPIVGDDLYHDSQALATSSPSSMLPHADKNNVDVCAGESDAWKVVAGLGLFLYAVGIAFDDMCGNRRHFVIDEPPKFARFRHFCAWNWEKRMEKLAQRQTQVGNTTTKSRAIHVNE